VTALWTAAAAQAATGGTGPGGWAATGLSSDTRTLRPGELFVALTGQRDGHMFVAEALARGAAAALVARRPEGVGPDAPLLMVPDVPGGLQALARAARARTRARVIGVTGSVGKTGTKEMLRTVLSAQGPTHAARRSFNNHWGVPLTVAAIPPDAAFAVVEIGMNHAGEIAPLSRLTRPHVAVVTTVAAVHLENFRSVAGIARAKAEIFLGLEPGGTAVINRDIPWYPILRRAAQTAGARLVRFGSGGRPELLLREVRVSERATQLSARVFGREMFAKLGSPGRHLALNALAVLGAVAAAGGDLARAGLDLARWSAPEGRGARWVVGIGAEAEGGSFVLIDDSYNANPTSVGAALDVLAAAPTEEGVGRFARGRRIAMLGDMLELGASELALHAALARHPAMAGIDRVHSCGPRMKALHEALPGSLRGEWFADSAGLCARAARLVDAGDVVLVKGSLGARMGPVVQALLQLGPARVDTLPAEEV
jgi:UDP-N-acetylmuramoyl-tripeptide--D-alanyl-D-alanine ligase